MILLDLPREIILNVLYFLYVKELLALELTCSYFRDTVATRHIWLLDLQRLVLMACVPPLPVYAHVDQLDYNKIRALVVGSLRQIKAYSSLKEGGFSNLTARQTTVNLETSQNAHRTQDVWNKLFYRLLPSSKFLLVASLHSLEIFDVQNNVCVWSYEPPHSAELRGFAFEECSETSFRLFLLQFSPARESLILHIFQLEQLECQETLRIREGYSMGHEAVPKFYLLGICLSEEFLAFSDLGILVIWNWKERMTWIIYLELGDNIVSLQIVQGYLSYVLMSRRRRYILELIPLRQLTNLERKLRKEELACRNLEIMLSSPGPRSPAVPQVSLCGLRRFGMEDEVVFYYLNEGPTEHDGINLCVATAISFDREWIRYLPRKSLPLLSKGFGRPATCDSSSPNGSLFPTLSGCIVHEGDYTMCDYWTFRLKPNEKAQAWSFNDNDKLYCVEIPSFTEQFDLVLQFDSGCLLRAFTSKELDPKRVIIHHLV
ncbi:hypothetical protein ACEPAG_8496 [Sanghuangporus baumii]